METLNIGEAAKASGVSAKMIRHYEEIGLLPRALRSNGNYRLYGPQEVHNLKFIQRARSLGFPLETIRELLALWRNRQRSSAQVKKLAMAHVETLEAKIAEIDHKIAALAAMKTALVRIAADCQGGKSSSSACPILMALDAKERRK